MKVIGLVSGSHKDVSIELPILIGTVPIVDNNQPVEPPLTQMPVSSVNTNAPMPDDREDSDSLLNSSELSPTAPPYPSDGRL